MNASEVIISCCSTADLSKEHFQKRNIHYICFHFELNGKEYLDDLGESISFERFYHEMEQGAETKTSQVNADEFIKYFRGFLQEGKDVVHVCLSSGISGVINSAMIAKETLEEEYPDRRIDVVDSLGASSGYGLLVDHLADLRDEGYGVQEISQWAQEHKLEVNHWFFSTDLSYYVKGGRISKTSGMVGGMLGICPLLHMDSQGKLVPRKKIRGVNKVIHAMVNQMEECVENGRDYDGKCYISQSGCMDYAKKTAQLIEERFPKLDGKVAIYYVGTTIGSHTGPGTVALFFWGRKREE